MFIPCWKLLLLKRLQSQRFKRVSWYLWLNSNIAVDPLLLHFPVRIFTTKRPNTFKFFRKMLKGFKTGVDEKTKQNKTHRCSNTVSAKLLWEQKENQKCCLMCWGQIVLFLTGCPFFLPCWKIQGIEHPPPHLLSYQRPNLHTWTSLLLLSTLPVTL